MSDRKHVYGWYGHILVSSLAGKRSRPKDGLVCVHDYLLKPLIRDYEQGRLPRNLVFEMRRLGTLDSDVVFWATGHSFSEGFTHSGIVFKPAIDREAQDKAYLDYMKDYYVVYLPPCNAMIGWSLEH